MKKFLVSIIAVIGLSLIGGAKTYAYSEINGNILGDYIGIIQFDGLNLGTDPKNPGNLHAGIFDWADGRCGSNATGSVTEPAYPVDYTWCEIGGFSWADSVGWMVWDGSLLDLVLQSGDFLSPADYARIVHNDDSGNPQPYIDAEAKPLAGYVWTENAGWIRLAKNNDYGTITDPASQTINDWGVFLDFSGASAKLRGFAWSEKLGWIKFNPESPFESTVFSGAQTGWIPDNTPPELYAVNYSWFPNQLESGLITWPDFSQDGESSIFDTNLTVSVATSQSGDPYFTNCNLPEAFNTNQNVTPPLSTVDPLALELDSVGIVKGTDAGYCKFVISGTISNAAGYSRYLMTAADLANQGISLPDPSWRSDPIVFYTRAGDPCTKANDNKYNTGENDCYGFTVIDPYNTDGFEVVADGTDSADYSIAFTDVANNPVVPVNPTDQDCNSFYCPTRDVTVTVDADNAMQYDATHTLTNDSYPVFIDSAELGKGNTSANVDLNRTNEKYEFSISSYSPTFNANKDALTLDDFNIIIDDEAIFEQSNIPPSPAGEIAIGAFNNSANPINVALNSKPAFQPALVGQNPQIDAKLTVGANTTLTYDLKNESTNSDLSNLSADTAFEYFSTDGGIGAALMEVRDIRDEGISSEYGRTDPIAGRTRYEIFNGSFAGSSAMANDKTVFHGNTNNYVPSYDFKSSPVASSTVNTSGIYRVEGIYGLPPENRSSIENPDTLPALQIDRSSSVSGLSLSTSSSTSQRTLNFTPEQWLPGDTRDVNLRIGQLLAYRFSSQPYFTIYKPAPLVPGVSVQSIGVKYSGIAAGKDIFETGADRELNVLGAPEVRGLKEAIRRNVARLTTGKDSCDVEDTNTGLYKPIVKDGQLNLNAFCINEVDNDENAFIAYYNGTPEETLIIKNDQTDSEAILVPSGIKYTLIVTGGANIYIKDNIAYGSNTSAFGIIVLQSDDGAGGNVYLDPKPTNLVGNLFAEGSLVSIDGFSGGSPIYFYGDPSQTLSNQLNNQLLWEGSIVSRNTIGGAPARKLPEGITCEAVVDLLDCAQRYDLDFVRRFIVQPTDSDSFVTSDGTLFSGGGSCEDGTCSFPSPKTLNSSIVLTNNSTVDLDKSVTDPFFVRRDPRLDSFTPPGFSVSAGLKRSQEIR